MFTAVRALLLTLVVCSSLSFGDRIPPFGEPANEEKGTPAIPFVLAKYRARLLEYHNFLFNYVIGRTVFTRIERAADDFHKFRVSYFRKMTFQNLTTTKTGLSFEAVEDVTHRTFPVGEDGVETGQEKNFDRKFTKRYEFGLRKSSGAMLGYAHYSNDPSGEMTGEAYELEAKLDKDELTVDDKLLMYADLPIDGGDFGTTSTTATAVLTVADGKLTINQTLAEFDVKEENFERTPRYPDQNGDPLPSATPISTEE
jgi:hypothetical protein